jgi:hypothetical protein
MKTNYFFATIALFLTIGCVSHAEFVLGRFKAAQCSPAILKTSDGKVVTSFRAFDVCFGHRIGTKQSEFVRIDTKLYQVNSFRCGPEDRCMGRYSLNLVGFVNAEGDLTASPLRERLAATFQKNADGLVQTLKVYELDGLAGHTIEAHQFEPEYVTL